MKVKVVKDSVIYDGSIYGVGKELELDVIIAKGLISNGYVVAIRNEQSQGVAEDSQEEQVEIHYEEPLTGHLDKEQLETMSYQDLKKLASDLGVVAKGSKEELIEKIVAVDVEVSADEEEESDELPNTSMPE